MSTRKGITKPPSQRRGSMTKGRNSTVDEMGIRDRADTGQNNAPRKVVGQYMLSKTIGEGTFGKVKLGRLAWA